MLGNTVVCFRWRIEKLRKPVQHNPGDSEEVNVLFSMISFAYRWCDDSYYTRYNCTKHYPDLITIGPITLFTFLTFFIQQRHAWVTVFHAHVTYTHIQCTARTLYHPIPSGESTFRLTMACNFSIFHAHRCLSMYMCMCLCMCLLRCYHACWPTAQN